MFSRSAWLHLRIPFSYFLLPIFLFSVGISPNLNQSRLLWVFLILHFFLFPASNGFNSYYDKDEKSIGGLKNPPPVNTGLLYLSLLFDLVAIVLGVIKVNWTFGIMLFIYGLASKAYSHPAIRLKKYPFSGWIITGFFQGFFTVLMAYVGINDFEIQTALMPKVLFAGLISSLMLWANYPMTQIYQHEEDAKRGDHTLSLRLGVMGTFYFTAGFFGLAALGFIYFFNAWFDAKYAWSFIIALSPVAVYFSYWFLRAKTDRSKADYRHTMLLNFISATALNVFFIWFFLDSSNVMNTF
jgi:1,4-dihydroxy-2-naphthoate octaprenyltransferase